jgi:hypothetical protein
MQTHTYEIRNYRTTAPMPKLDVGVAKNNRKKTKYRKRNAGKRYLLSDKVSYEEFKE